MDQDKVLDCSIDLSKIKPFITTTQNGAKKLYFKIRPRKTPDKYGHNVSVYIRYKADDGNFYTEYIGDGKELDYSQNPGVRTAAPAPAQAAPARPAPARPAAPAPQAPAAPAQDPNDDLPF